MEHMPNIEDLAAVETKGWKAYYEKDFKLMVSSIEKIFEIQFGLSHEQAVEVTQLYAKFAALFGELPVNTPRADYQKLLPLLVGAYAVLNRYVPLKDYEQVAQFELEWMVDRRDSKTSPPIFVGSSMAKMFAALGLNDDIKILEKAAYLRAAAGQYRDLTQHKWGGMTSHDWDIIEQMLLNCYQTLYQVPKKTEVGIIP
jgi:hypothetical protein